MKALFLNILVIFLLSGCASHIHQVDMEYDATFIRGELAHEDGVNNRLVLETPDRRYEARGFTVERDRNLAELRKRYRVGSRHWRRISDGTDRNHLMYSVKTIAKSADGQALSCQLLWKSQAKPAGVCTDQDGKEFPVHFEGPSF